jgi:hypothetical protein
MSILWRALAIFRGAEIQTLFCAKRPAISNPDVVRMDFPLNDESYQAIDDGLAVQVPDRDVRIATGIEP